MALRDDEEAEHENEHCGRKLNRGHEEEGDNSRCASVDHEEEEEDGVGEEDQHSVVNVVEEVDEDHNDGLVSKYYWVTKSLSRYSYFCSNILLTRFL